MIHQIFVDKKKKVERIISDMIKDIEADAQKHLYQTIHKT